MKFLFAMFQGTGNIHLITPVVSELVARGHDVRVLAGPGIRRDRLPVDESFVSRIHQTGAAHIDLKEPEPHPYDNEPPIRGVVGSWMPRGHNRASIRGHQGLWSSCWAANVVSEIEREPVDAIASDYLLLGALAASEATGIPSAALVHTIPPPLATGGPPQSSGYLPPRNPVEQIAQAIWRWTDDRILARNGLELHNRARSELGLPALRDIRHQYRSAARVLMLTSKAFDFPARRIPSNVRYVGTPIDDSASVGDWNPPWPESDDRPLVLVSLSTGSQGQAPIMHQTLKALSQLPVKAVVTLGPSLNRADFEAPADALVEAFLPHSGILPYASAVVTQCGIGTLMKTLLHGVPAVCIPMGVDQPDNAARVVAHGAGLRLTREASADEIRAALQRVLNDPSFRTSAASLADRMSSETGADMAANELEHVGSGLAVRAT